MRMSEERQRRCMERMVDPDLSPDDQREAITMLAEGLREHPDADLPAPLANILIRALIAQGRLADANADQEAAKSDTKTARDHLAAIRERLCDALTHAEGVA